ncbi:MAG: hypothetical protein M3P39_08900 [Actinomycetota bacterium]|nr:hypothetical protein [Actinomycetota bacterium]
MPLQDWVPHFAEAQSWAAPGPILPQRHVDLRHAHRVDPDVPIEETIEALLGTAPAAGGGAARRQPSHSTGGPW